MFAPRGAFLLTLALATTCSACGHDGHDGDDGAPPFVARGDIPMGAIGAVGADVPASSSSVSPEPPMPRRMPRPRGVPDPFGGGLPPTPSAAAPSPHKHGGTSL